MRFMTFDADVRDICSAMGDDNARMYPRVGKQLRRILDLMNLTTYQTYSTDEFEIGENLNIDLPDNVMEVQKVGVIVDGQLVVMGYNDKIRRSATAEYDAKNGCTCGGKKETTVTSPETTSTSNDYCPVCCFQNVNWGGRMYGEIYGIRPDRFQNGTYRWDRNTNTLEFGSGYDIDAGSKVWVEYKSSLKKSDYNEIQSEMYFCLMFMVQYVLNAASNPQLSAYAMTEFRRHHHQLKTFYQRRNIEDYFDAVVSNYSASLKK